MTDHSTDGTDDTATPDFDENQQKNVYGDPLEPCSKDPETGALRDGYCRSLARDPGRHEVCAVVTREFLEFSQRRGNDLITPRSALDFPGLEDGDRWCLCVPRWIEAHEAGVAPPVVLEATNEDVLDEIDVETLESYAYEGAAGEDEVGGDETDGE